MPLELIAFVTHQLGAAYLHLLCTLGSLHLLTTLELFQPLGEFAEGGIEGSIGSLQILVSFGALMLDSLTLLIDSQ